MRWDLGTDSTDQIETRRIRKIAPDLYNESIAENLIDA